MSISEKDKLHFWVSISGGALPEDATFDMAYNFWYKKPRYRDIYDAVANIPYDKTFARTVHGIRLNPNREQIVSTGKNYVASRLKNLDFASQSDFDKWHKESVLELIKVFKDGGQTLHVGQGQKWMNMALKHLWLADESKVGRTIEYCHVPLDNYLYAAMHKSDAPEPFKALDFPFNPEKNRPWSRIDDYDAYLAFQQQFRGLFDTPPLVAEFELWQGQKDIQ